MGNIFLLIFKKITILNSILMIIYCIFDPDIGSFQFLFIIALLLLLSWIIWLTGKILNYFSIKKHSIKKDPQTNNIILLLFFWSICYLLSSKIYLPGLFYCTPIGLIYWKKNSNKSLSIYIRSS